MLPRPTPMPSAEARSLAVVRPPLSNIRNKSSSMNNSDRPGSSKSAIIMASASRSTPTKRPSTAGATSNSRSGGGGSGLGEQRRRPAMLIAEGELRNHVMTQLFSLESTKPMRHVRSESNQVTTQSSSGGSSSSSRTGHNTRPATGSSSSTPPVSMPTDRGHTLATSSSWNTLRFKPKSSKESLREDAPAPTAASTTPRPPTGPLAGTPGPSANPNAGLSTIRRFQSLGFLRRKRSASNSISSFQSPSYSSLAAASNGGGSSHGHSGSANSNSSHSSSHNHQGQQQQRDRQVQNQRVQVQAEASTTSSTSNQAPAHSVSAATVFPSLTTSSTFAITVTPRAGGPSAPSQSSSTGNGNNPQSFVRPPKANPSARRSVSLYEIKSSAGANNNNNNKTHTKLVKRNNSISHGVADSTSSNPTPPAAAAAASSSSSSSRHKLKIPMPPTKTKTVARTPCTYDVTTAYARVRPVRPRSSSVPLGRPLDDVVAALASLSNPTDSRTSRFEVEERERRDQDQNQDRVTASKDGKKEREQGEKPAIDAPTLTPSLSATNGVNNSEVGAAVATTAAVTVGVAGTSAASRGLNTTAPKPDESPSSSSPQSTMGLRSVTTPRAQNRYAAVYRAPPPPATSAAVARDGHGNPDGDDRNAASSSSSSAAAAAAAAAPRPALALSMPTGVSIIESMPLSRPVRAHAHAHAHALHTPNTANSARVRPNPSPSSPYVMVPPPSSALFSPSMPSASTPSSSRPPPRAAIPESPEASPESRSKPLPVIPPFSPAPSPSPSSRTNNINLWARQRTKSTSRVSNTPTSWAGDERQGAGKPASPLTVRDPFASPWSEKSNQPSTTAAARPALQNARTIYAATPSFPISNQRRPSLPNPSPRSEAFDRMSISTSEDSLWGYFEKVGLASSTSPVVTTAPRRPPELLRSRSTNTLSQMASKDESFLPYLISPTESTFSPGPTRTVMPMPKEPLPTPYLRRPTNTYLSSPLSSGAFTPQTPASAALQTPPLTSGSSPISPMARRKASAPATPSSLVAPIEGGRIKLSSGQTIVLREPPHTRPSAAAPMANTSTKSQVRQRPTHLISQSLPSPTPDASFNLPGGTPAYSQVIFLDEPRRGGQDGWVGAINSIFTSPFPSPGVAFPVTPITPATPWLRSSGHGMTDGDADSLIIPPSPI